MKFIVFILFLTIGYTLSSQSIISSQTQVRTCLQENECSLTNSSSYLFYDETKNQFYLKVDFNKLKTGQDSVDYWLNDLSDTYLYFIAPLQKENFPSLSNANAKTFYVNGKVLLNNIWHDQKIELSIFLTDNSSLNFSQTANKYMNYKVSFGFPVVPKDYKIHKKAHHLKNTIFISIGLGQINLLEPGMEAYLKEVYDAQH